MFEAVDAAISVWGADRVGLHIAPRGDAHSMGDSDLKTTFTYVAREMSKRKIAFLCAREHKAADWLGPQLKAAFGGVYIANENFDKASAEEVVAKGEADAVAFGKLYIANPDLVERFKRDAELNPWTLETFYAPGPEGYTDYPALIIG